MGQVNGLPSSQYKKLDQQFLFTKCSIWSLVSPKKKTRLILKKWIFLPSHISKNTKPQAKFPAFKIRDFQICHNNTYVLNGFLCISIFLVFF